MESKRGRISGSSNWSKRGGNAKEEDGGSTKLAGTLKCQRSTEVFRSHQLLQKIYKRLHQVSSTAACAGQEGAEGEQEEAFERLKAVFTTEPVLAIPDIDREMRVEADTSDYAMGRVLLTKCEDGKWRLVAFISKSLNATE